MVVLNRVMAFLFLVSVLLQLNDPDPWTWMPLYGAAAATCVAADRGRLDPRFAVALAGISLLWAVRIVLALHLDVPLLTALTDWGMHSGGSEESREAGGLLLVALWMLVLARRTARERVATR